MHNARILVWITLAGIILQAHGPGQPVVVATGVALGRVANVLGGIAGQSVEALAANMTVAAG